MPCRLTRKYNEAGWRAIGIEELGC